MWIRQWGGIKSPIHDITGSRQRGGAGGGVDEQLVQNLKMVRSTDIHDDKANTEPESATRRTISPDDTVTLELLDAGTEGQYGTSSKFFPT